MKPASELPPVFKPPQFSLRTLLLLMTLLAVLFALVNVLPPMVIAGLVFLLLSIFAHVAGNAIGTRLRDIGSRPTDRSLSPPAHSAEAGKIAKTRCAPPTELSHRHSLGWPVVVVTAAGAAAAGIAGGIWAVWLTGDHITALGVLVGSIACGVLGGFAAFLAFSFTQVGLGALKQASMGGSASAEETRR